MKKILDKIWKLGFLLSIISSVVMLFVATVFGIIEGFYSKAPDWSKTWLICNVILTVFSFAIFLIVNIKCFLIY